MDDATKGLIITTLAVLLVVPDSLFVRLIDASPLTIAFWRLLLPGAVLGAGIFWVQGAAPFGAVLATGRFGVIYTLGAGLSGVLFTLAVSLTSVANVVFILASLPVFAAVYSRIFLAEPISTRLLLTIAAVAAGLAVIVYGSGENADTSLVGDALALSVSALFAAALTAARRVKHVSMVPGVAMGHVAVALLILPLADPLSVSQAQVPLVLAHGTFILGSSVLLALGPRFITSAEVGLLVLLESALAPILAWVVIGEHPGSYTIAGGTIVIGALFVSNMVALRRVKSRH